MEKSEGMNASPEEGKAFEILSREETARVFGDFIPLEELKERVEKAKEARRQERKAEKSLPPPGGFKGRQFTEEARHHVCLECGSGGGRHAKMCSSFNKPEK